MADVKIAAERLGTALQNTDGFLRLIVGARDEMSALASQFAAMNVEDRAALSSACAAKLDDLLGVVAGTVKPILEEARSLAAQIGGEGQSH
ncbi:hypothetical protein [Longispora albida]|uniref:hypothetical protein n=1 Tax=Longispora albida TaxID=203523 RepID=UPI0003666709|nr:hypothetical protein [Longispora albida]